MKKIFIGIDFSKEKFDVAIISAEGLNETAERVFNEFKNSVSGFKQFVKWVGTVANGIEESLWLFCGENTGDYSKPLCNHLYGKRQEYQGCFRYQKTEVRPCRCRAFA